MKWSKQVNAAPTPGRRTIVFLFLPRSAVEIKQDYFKGSPPDSDSLSTSLSHSMLQSEREVIDLNWPSLNTQNLRFQTVCLYSLNHSTAWSVLFRRHFQANTLLNTPDLKCVEIFKGVLQSGDLWFCLRHHACPPKNLRPILHSYISAQCSIKFLAPIDYSQRVFIVVQTRALLSCVSS